MITRVEIPKLTLTMDSGTLVKWLKQEGEPVEKGEFLFQLETDKTVVELPSPERGLLKKIVVREGTVAVGKTVAFIGDTSDPLPDVAEDEGGSSGQLRGLGRTAPPAQSAEVGSVRATPAARRRARELGLDLARVVGTGPEGRITQEDVERLGAPSASGSPRPPEDHRRLIGERTGNTWRTVPHIHIGGELLARGVMLALESGRASVGPSLSITDLLLYTTASLLGQVKPLNGVWRNDQLEAQPHVHLAFAVQTDLGLVAQVIHDADQLSLARLAVKRKDLTERALTRRLELAELAGGTFTVTNLGMYPVDFFAPVINHPQVAILATGRVRQVAAVRGTQISPEWRMWANLAVDHRAADGATAAQFLRRLEEAIEALPDRISRVLASR
jgi:pyruvate dehydrogenase E2 component (dihydrolipoyllysine-residue acetyltransferase)